MYLTHGLKNHHLYSVWTSMKARCGHTKGGNEKDKKIYQENGITVCKEWLNFEPFFKWANKTWKPGLEIDRIDTLRGYRPDNCRFVSRKANAQNSRRSKWWFVRGERFSSISDASEKLGIGMTTIRMWCDGAIQHGKWYPPKKDCYSIRKYA